MMARAAIISVRRRHPAEEDLDDAVRSALTGLIQSAA
jgi:hypothetical protein